MAQKDYDAIGKHKELNDIMLKLLLDRSACIKSIRERLHKISYVANGICTEYNMPEMERAIRTMNDIQVKLMAVVHEMNEHAAAANEPRIQLTDVAVVGIISQS